LELSAKTEYAVRAMIDLAAQGGGQTTFDEIARRQRVPPTFIPQIMRDLGRAGLVTTVRGFGGGVRLAMAPEAISVRAVFEAVQGPMALYRCLAQAECDHEADCALRDVWIAAQAEMLRVFERTTLADLLTNVTKQKCPGCAASTASQSCKTNREATHAR
jgi:Rrf2 family protein